MRDVGYGYAAHYDAAAAVSATPAGGQEALARRRPSPESMAVVQTTAAAVAHRPTALAEAFYDHLFAMAPQLRPMFPADMNAQNERLCRILFDAVRALSDPHRYASGMEQNLRLLGCRHAQRYGVQPAHYPFVGHALVRAVSDVSGNWSAEASSAWIGVYDWMASHMLAGLE